MDLIRCQTEDRHNGKLFICPNTNLVENQVRRTCLGALFFGHSTEAIEKCLYFPHKLEHREEFAKQIALDQIIFSARENITIIKTCPDSIRTLQNVTGLTKSHPDVRSSQRTSRSNCRSSLTQNLISFKGRSGFPDSLCCRTIERRTSKVD
jgi:hypothetical protein